MKAYMENGKRIRFGKDFWRSIWQIVFIALGTLTVITGITFLRDMPGFGAIALALGGYFLFLGICYFRRIPK